MKKLGRFLTSVLVFTCALTVAQKHETTHPAKQSATHPELTSGCGGQVTNKNKTEPQTCNLSTSGNRSLMAVVSGSTSMFGRIANQKLGRRCRGWEHLIFCLPQTQFRALSSTFLQTSKG
jgi:hypothetical protein